MKIKKIEVQITNYKLSTDVSILVDKEEFLKKIAELRQKWDITELYKPPNLRLFLEWHIMTNKDKIADKEEIDRRLKEFNLDIAEVLKICKRTRNFKQVVEYALATGIVPDYIYRSCYFDLVTIGESEDLEKPEKYQYVIVLSPRTQKQEVEEVFKEFKTYITGKIDFDKSNNIDMDVPSDRELIDQYHRGSIYEGSNIDKFDNPRELDRTREWYWMRFENYFNGNSKKPKTYSEIIEEWHLRCPDYETADKLHAAQCRYCSIGDESYIEHALSAYYKLLK